MKFLRGITGLHKNGSGVSDEVLRAEVGCERIEDRWSKLRLGYWRRIYTAPRGRLLRDLIDFRRREWMGSDGRGWGTMGWVGTVKQSLDSHGLTQFWNEPDSSSAVEKSDWKMMVYGVVNRESDSVRAENLTRKSSSVNYINIKHWGVNTAEYSFSSGETGRLGQHVPERYLDDRANLKGTRLKMLSRLGCLPLMHRVGREAKPP